MLALASALQQRAHVVTLFGLADVAETVRHAGVGFTAVGEHSHPPGTQARLAARLAGPIGGQWWTADGHAADGGRSANPRHTHQGDGPGPARSAKMPCARAARRQDDPR
jgi:hypothetical protein